MTIDELATKVDNLATTVEKGFKDVFESMDDLAGMTAKGFQEVAESFGGVENRLTVVEHKVDALRTDMSSVVFDSKKTQGRVENLEVATFGSIQAA